MEKTDTTRTESKASDDARSAAPLPSPVLESPREAAVVNGQEVTFSWRAVDDASAYVLQVARTAKFDDLLFEEDLGEQTAATVAGLFPTDGQTFFWRVLARDGDGATSRGGRVESFIAVTAEKAEKHLAAPQVQEDMGPVTELVRAAGEDISTQMLESGSNRFEREKEMGVAYEGIAAGQILAIAMSILLVIAIAVVIVFNWASTWADATREASIDPSNYTTLQETEIDAARQLNQYEIVNEQEGIYRIPIDRAMEIIATEEYRQQSATETQTNATPPNTQPGDSQPGDLQSGDPQPDGGGS